MTFETGFVRAAARWTRVLHSCWPSWSRARKTEVRRRKLGETRREVVVETLGILRKRMRTRENRGRRN